LDNTCRLLEDHRNLRNTLEVLCGKGSSRVSLEVLLEYCGFFVGLNVRSHDSHNLLFANALPEPVFRYLSKSSAFCLSVNASAVFQPPRFEFRCMRAFSGIVCLQSTVQIFSELSLVRVRICFSLQDVDVIEFHVNFLRRDGEAPDFVLSYYRRGPTSYCSTTSRRAEEKRINACRAVVAARID
jgi:hypothetical protein